jgi:hypothetical protein
MRATMQLGDDVLAAARVLARQRQTSLGAVISALARQALVAPRRLAPALATPNPTNATACPCCPGRPRARRWIWS